MLRRSLRHYSLLFMLAMAASPLAAAPPWVSLVPFKKVEADARKEYKVTKANGPWMIMAMSFSGDEAEEQARKLALELRRDHRVEAWVHHQQVELEDTVEGLGVDQYGNPKKMKYLHGDGLTEYAVLIGNFQSFDDPDAAKTLEKVRYMRPKSLSGGIAQRSGMSIRDAYLRASQGEKARVRGPLGRAFITRNPLLPPEEVAKETLDSFVVELNSGVPNSLLQNKGRYTVQIASYRGASAYSEKEFEEKQRKSGGTYQLAQAAQKATNVCDQLRKDGVEAYVFHDRHESIVTVGSFNDIGQENDNGVTELRSDVARVIKQFEAKKSSLANVNTRGLVSNDQVGLIPQVVAGAPLDVSPRLIQVPRQSIADVYRK